MKKHKCYYCGEPLKTPKYDKENKLICDVCLGMVYCDSCGKHITTEETREIDGLYYCNSCAESRR